VPERLASLVHDLNRELSLPDLASALPWSETQLRDSLELLKLPADLNEQLERQVRSRASQAPIPVSVVMLPREHALFEQALARAAEELGEGARRGELWAHISRSYLGQATGGNTEGPFVEVEREPAVGDRAGTEADAPSSEAELVILRPLGER